MGSPRTAERTSGLDPTSSDNVARGHGPAAVVVAVGPPAHLTCGCIEKAVELLGQLVLGGERGELSFLALPAALVLPRPLL